MKMSQQDKYSILSRESEVGIIRKVDLRMNEQKKIIRHKPKPGKEQVKWKKGTDKYIGLATQNPKETADVLINTMNSQIENYLI